MRDPVPPSDTGSPREPDSLNDPEEDSGLLIVVIRTGGIAGIRKRWHVEPQRDEEPRWIELIDRCPWDDPAGARHRGADRYVWSIQARTPSARRERELPESALDGPWLRLVDAVRAAEAG